MPRLVRKIAGKSKDKREDDDFQISGPKHLSRVDWRNDDHRRAVAACLVQGAYTKHADIKNKVDGAVDAALAPPWWENLGFKFKYNISDLLSKSVGVVYEFDESHARRQGEFSVDRAPRFVIAYRGTRSVLDAVDDVVLTIQRYEGSCRIRRALDGALKVTRESRNIWLAGHSLGASIATFIGIMLLEQQGVSLETFLFNPPFLRLDPVTLRHERVKKVVEALHKLLEKLLDRFMTDADNFGSHTVLQSWTPRLFVHPDDYICKGFIDYFENKEGFYKGMRSSNLFRIPKDDGGYRDYDRVFRGVDTRPVYLLPSGEVAKNTTPIQAEDIIGSSIFFGERLNKMLHAHRLNQWWRDDQQLDRKEYPACQAAAAWECSHPLSTHQHT